MGSDRISTKTIHTIGHSNHPIDRFIDLLRRHGVRTLVDVRSRPYSRWAPQFQKRALSRSLELEAVAYVFLGDELGGRPVGEGLYDRRGRLDVERRAQARDFQAGVDRLVEIAQASPVAILCAEENPARCHRRLLVTPALRLRGWTVAHIRGDGRVEDDQDLRAESVQRELFD